MGRMFLFATLRVNFRLAGEFATLVASASYQAKSRLGIEGYAERTICRQYRDTTDREREGEGKGGGAGEKRERTGKSQDGNKRAPELVVPRNIGKRVEPQKNYIELRQAEERN